MTVAAPADTADVSRLEDLVRRAQDGCQEAAREVYERCRQPLLAIIRRHLGSKLRSKYDSDDFLMQTFAKIFTRHFSEQVLKSPETLWPYMAKIAQNDVRDAVRRLSRERRDHGREQSVEGLRLEEELRSHDLSPHDQAWLRQVVVSKLAQVLRAMQPRQQEICWLILQRENVMAIAAQVGCKAHEVYRAMDELRNELLK